MQSDSELITPFDVEREMVELNNRIEKAPSIVKEWHEKVRSAKQTYRKKYNLAYSAAMGTAMERRIEAEMATEQELALVDFAEIEYKYVSDTLDALKTKLRALQSISSLMKAQMFSPQGGI